MKKIIIALVSFLCLHSAFAQEGLYLRTQFWGGGSLDISWLYFTKDGVICKNPTYGINPFNLQICYNPSSKSNPTQSSRLWNE